MGVRNVEFQGRTYVRPGARGAFTAEPSQLGPSDDLSTLILIGAADNGVNANDTALNDNERFYIFQDFTTAKSVLRGGKLLEAIKLAFAPSNDGDFELGPQFIKAFNFNPNVAATATFDTTKAANLATVSAVVAGPAGNLVRMRKILSTKQVEIANEDSVETSPPTGINVFTVQYTGDASTAVIEITATGITITLAGDQTDGSVNLVTTFAQLPTLGEWVNFVNAQTGYTATTIEGFDFKMAELDHIESSETISVLTALTVTADYLGDERFINASGIAKITTQPAVRKPLADLATFRYLTGGATGVPTSTNVQNAIDFSEKETGLYANLLDTTLANQLYFRESIKKLNSPDGGNERFGGVGGASADTLSDRLDNARLMASRFMCYGVTKFNQFNVAGDEVEFEGQMTAVLHNAIKAAASPHRAVTYKDLNILGTDEVHTKLERDQIIKAGGLVIAQVEKATSRPYVIERGLTTEQSANLVFNESNTVASGLTMVKELRAFFQENYIGDVPVDDNALVAGPREGDLISGMELKLQEFVERGLLRGSALLGIAPFNQNFTLEIDGDTFRFRDVQGNVSPPINFVFYLLELSVISGTTGG